MKKFCLKRVVESVIVLILISFFSFGVIELAPGDISSMYISPTMTEEEKQATIEKLGLDRSMGERYVEWFKGVLQGDFGVSLSNKRPVAEQFAEKLPATILLMSVSLALSLIISIPLGLIAGLKKNTIIDRIINLIAYIGVSIPSFWLAMVMIIVFSLKLRLLPSSGMHTIGVDSAWETSDYACLYPMYWKPCNIYPIYSFQYNRAAGRGVCVDRKIQGNQQGKDFVPSRLKKLSAPDHHTDRNASCIAGSWFFYYRIYLWLARTWNTGNVRNSVP